MPSKFTVIGKSDIGLVRTGNEDNLLIDEKNQVFAVCDGMGGHQAGEVASMVACEMIRAIFEYFPEEINNDPTLNLKKTFPPAGDILVKSIRLANHAIYTRAADNPSLQGMGTTVVALALENDMLSIAHVGDSRAYRIKERELEPLTIDHSWVAEIQQSQNITEDEASQVVGKNVITRALGVRDTVEVDYRLIKVNPGDKFILCSDGLCGYADDDDIFGSIANIKDNNEKIVDSLIQMANDRGGADNVTIVVLEVIESSDSNLPEVDKVTIPIETEEELAAEDNWLKKIDEFFAHKDEKENSEESPPNKKFLYIIFALFIIIAVVIIYMSVGE